MKVDALFDQLKDGALPGVWSRGLALARDKAVVLDTETPEGFILRVKAPGKSVSPKVSVWPADEDVHCDCDDQADPCMHAVAAVVALKNGWAQAPEAVASAGRNPQLIYRFSERGGMLAFQRVILRTSGTEEVLQTSLVSFVGGITSGRIAEAPLLATREDFKVDQVLSALEEQNLIRQDGLDRRAIPRLFTALQEVSGVEFSGARVKVNPTPIRIQAVLKDVAGGVQLMEHTGGSDHGASAGVESGATPVSARAESAETPVEARTFFNGVVLSGDTFRTVQEVSFLVQSSLGKTFSDAELPAFVLRVLPVLQKELDLEIKSRKLPELQRMEPGIVLETAAAPDDREVLEVMARLVYGNPPSAEVIDGKLDLTQGAKVIPLRDEAAEQALLRDLQSELHLKPRQRVRLTGGEALEFVQRSKRWKVTGAAQEDFSVQGSLVPELQASRGGLSLNFRLQGHTGPLSKASSSISSADPSKVLQAWKRGESQVPLLEGGWAVIPQGWLDEHGETLERFLQLRKPGMLQQVQLADFTLEAGGVLAPDLKGLQEQLTEYQGIPQQSLPADLRAELRPYQRLGVNWLGFLRTSGLGALLADDMGLGKTLQALCAIRGRTLVIAPTSVLPSWESQIRNFRPGLRLNVYYGTGRKLVSGADVVLTSYGTLRQDRALLTTAEWDSIILDEAQHIKNPDSQITRIVHELRGGFRIALTGTPIENRLDDLWSQVQFVQPGLLGTRQEFQMRFAAGQVMDELKDLKRKIKPLILRRMKRDVAPELPPKTEVTLYSTLDDREQTAYRTLMAATRETVVKELEAGGSILHALEALLRLRQVCAHPSLVPGFEEKEFRLSSKLELLRETLEESLALGHSVLIFSQWTSFLDLVENVLREMGTGFLRLDGSTPNRSEVIDRFQDPEGPRVMILSLKAGGVGLTLTKADHVIILDPWWNPAVEDQAADRAHRIGQTQPVLVQRLVARDTVEDRIVQLQAKKRRIAEQVLGAAGEGGAALELTREDLLELLR